MQKQIIVLSVFVVFSSISWAEDGVWTTDDSFAQINVFCTRMYKCVPGVDVLHGSDTKIISTPPKIVQGVCSAGGGPADSCNDCLTNPPSDKCEWHLGPN